jgi:hypothetical protein
MKISKKKMTTTQLIKNMLITSPRLRDCDKELAKSVWFWQLKAMDRDPYAISFFDFTELQITKKLTAYDYITRQRRQLQEKNVYLRGEKWAERQAKQVAARKNLGYNG